MVQITESGSGITFSVRVHPRASKNEIAGKHAGALKIRLTAPPVEGRANEACCRFLAEVLNIPASAVSILSGERSRTKRVRVQGVTAQRIRELAAASSR